MLQPIAHGNVPGVMLQPIAHRYVPDTVVQPIAHRHAPDTMGGFNSAIVQLYHGENKLIFNKMIMKSTLFYIPTR
jgi:hypothetical protein